MFTIIFFLKIIVAKNSPIKQNLIKGYSYVANKIDPAIKNIIVIPTIFFKL